MNEQLIREIVDPVARKQVSDLTGDLEKNYKLLQDNILAAAKFNDILAQSKGFKDFDRNSANSAKAQEEIAKKIAQTQLAEEKLAAFRSAQLAKEQAIIDKKIANENKLAEAAIRRAKIVKESTASDISNSSGGLNGRTLIKGSPIFPDEIKKNQIDSTGSAYVAQSGEIKENTKAVQQNALSKKQLALIEAQEKENLRQNALALKNQAKELNAAKGSLDQRAAALNRLQKQLSSLNEQERNSPFGVRLTKTVGQLNTQVLELEKGALGKSGRNVGNYPLFNGIQQGASKAFGVVRTLANILPGIGIAGILGFAIEPIVQYIQQLDIFKFKLSEATILRKQLADVNLQGAKNAQAELVQLKTIYGITTDVTKSQELRYNAAKKLQEQYPQTFKNFSLEEISLGKANKGYLDLTNAIIATAKARASQDKLVENSSRQLDNEVKVTEALIEYDKQGLIAAEALQKARDPKNAVAAQGFADRAARAEERRAEAAKIIRDAKKDSLILDQRNAALVQNIDVQIANGADVVDLKTPKAKDQSKKLEAIARKNAAALIQIEIDANKEAVQYYQQGLENQNFGLDGRLESLKNFSDTSVEIVRLEGEKEKAAKKLTANEILAVDADTALKTQKIREDSANKVYEITKQSLARTNSAIAEQSAKDLAAIETERDQVLSALEESYANGFISLQNYNFRKSEIEKQYTLQYIGLQIEQTKVAIEQAKLRGENTEDAERKLSETELKYQQLRVANTKTATDKQIEKAKERFELEKQIAQELFNLTTTLFKRGSELRLNALQEESDAIDKQRDKDINAAEKTVINETEKNKRIKEINSDATLSETERKNKIAQLNKEIEESESTKADRIAIINAKADSQQQLIEQRVRQEKIKQAKADKAAAIAQAIINGALAMTKVAAQTGVLTFAFSPLIAALTAVQVAAIVAQPIPKYKDGKSASNNYSGAAWVGDGGMSELVIEPNGSMWVTPDKPTLTHVGKDTQVISGPEFKRMLAKPTSYGGQSGSGIDLTPLIAAQDKGANKITKAFKSQKSYNTIMTEKGFRTGQMKSSKTNEYFNRNFR